jgi:disulfide bond formation protein DsbB
MQHETKTVISVNHSILAWRGLGQDANFAVAGMMSSLWRMIKASSGSLMLQQQQQQQQQYRTCSATLYMAITSAHIGKWQATASIPDRCNSVQAKKINAVFIIA